MFWFIDDSFYEGQFENNMKHGDGVFKFGDGSCYEGEFYRDVI